MSDSNTGSILATLTQSIRLDQVSVLVDRVKDLSIGEFVCLLDFITSEFQQFLRALDMINNDALESILEQIMDSLTLKIGQVLQADHTTVFLVDSENGQLWSRITQAETGHSSDLRIPINVGIVGYVATTGESLNIQDAYHHPLFNQDIDERTGYHTKTLLCMPVKSSDDKIIAVVRLLNKNHDQPFNDEDEQCFRDFATSMGVILETYQSFYLAARNQRGASALLKATSSLGQTLDLETTLQSVMDQARQLMNADRSTLFMLSKDTGELWSKIAKADGKTIMEIRIPANRGIAGYVASTGQSLNILDAYTDPRFDPSTDKRTGYHTHNILCMPVFNSAGDLIGVTQLINKMQGSFTQSDEEFMQAFNTQAGMALDNAKLFEHVLTQQQHQKDILESLSDAVISTDLQGRIFTINDAALELLGCPYTTPQDQSYRSLWEAKLIGRYVWDVIPMDSIRWRLTDSLQTGARHYVPEQNFILGLGKQENEKGESWNILAIPLEDNPDYFLPWNEVFQNGEEIVYLTPEQVTTIERSFNLTVNPLTTPEGLVRGGLVVLEDISMEKRMKSTLYRYMTPGVAEQVIKLGDAGLMVGERKEVSILFSDIRGYTTITENLEATEVVALLNKYFETMVEAVFNYDGTLDKFIGDALMAVFGAPLPLKEHAWMAVQSALDMHRRLGEFNQQRLFDNQPKFRIGIGISSGEVVSGNIGSEKRMDYTVIGDGVNLSSRLESLTKEYHCTTIISEFTHQLCSDRIIARELDRVRVKGKQQAVRIYELLGTRDDILDPETEKFLEIYNQGLDAYLKRDFSQATDIFFEAFDLRTDDPAVEYHFNRAREYRDNPPPDNWDGVYIPSPISDSDRGASATPKKEMRG